MGKREPETQAALPELGLSGLLLEEQEEQTDLDKVLKLLLDPENIRHNTELTQNEITAFSVLSTISARHPSLKALHTFLAENLILRVSKGRQGRKEWVKIVSRHLSRVEDMPDMSNGSRPWSRYFNRRR